MAGRLAAVLEESTDDLDHFTAAYSPPCNFYRDLIRSVAVTGGLIRSSALFSQPGSTGSSYSSHSGASSSYPSNNSGLSSGSAHAGAAGARALCDLELRVIARRMVGDGYTQRMVQAFHNAPNDALERWFLELDVDWVLRIHELEQLQGSSRPPLQGLVEKWIRAFAVILLSMRELHLANIDEPTPASARFGKASIAQMLAFVDAIIPAAPPPSPSPSPGPGEKFWAVLNMYVCVSDAPSFKWSRRPIPQETQSIIDDINGSLSREENRLNGAIFSTTEEVRTLMEEEDSWAIEIPRGGGEVHRNTRFLVDFIVLIRSAVLNYHFENLRPLIHDTVDFLEGLLLRKSEMCSDPGLRYLFLLNNSFFVTQQLEPSELLAWSRNHWELPPASKRVFKESPHPDEKQRQQLSDQLGLSPRQVKFWFQNRRTQIKAIQERHENSLLKSELENVQKENRAMRELASRPSRCPSCGVAATSNDDVIDAAAARQEQQLQLENAQLKAEIEKLRATLGKAASADGVTSPAFSAGTVLQTNSRKNPLEDYGGGLTSHDKQSILELAGRALEELVTMCSSGEPLWVRSLETGRDILNYDEYLRLFGRGDDSGDQRAGWSVEASRESGVVYIDAMQLVHGFMDVNQWKELFLPMIAKASTLDVIRTGENDGPDGVVQLIFAEVQMLTPMVPTRELCFARYCKKLAAEKWATVDVSFDKAEAGGMDPSPPARCWKNPSGCIIEEQTNGHSRVTWVEHTEIPESAVPSPMYRAVTASGLAFGARRWVATLQLQCERMVFSVATNVPTRDSNGVSTLAGRRSVLKLAHRMTSSLCRGIGGSRGLAWSRVTRAGAGDIRLTSRRSAAGEPQGLIACAVLSTWLPVGPTALLDFLRDESRRPEWDATLSGGSVQRRVNLAKGKDRGNCVTAYAATSAPAGDQQGRGKWIVQDSSRTSSCEAIVAYAAVDAAVLQPVISGHDSSGVAVLPCGFAAVPDGLEYSRPAVITSSSSSSSRKGDVAAGSLLTVAFQVLASSSPTATLSPDSAEAVIGLVSCTLRDIRKALGCEDR